MSNFTNSPVTVTTSYPDEGKIFFLVGSPDYIPVIFREPDFSTAVLTAMRAKAYLYRWNERDSCWNLLHIPSEASRNKDHYGMNLYPHTKRRFDCLFEMTDAYYYAGAGVIVFPERIVIKRRSLFDDKPLPDCPLRDYDIYSDTDYREMLQLIRQLENK